MVRQQDTFLTRLNRKLWHFHRLSHAPKVTFTEKYALEERLLREICAENPEDFDFIQECLILQKNKSLIIRKGGLKAELERHLERYIAKDRLKVTANG